MKGETEHLARYFTTEDHFVKPDLRAFAEGLNSEHPDNIEEAINEFARLWLKALQTFVGANYALFESEHFIFLVNYEKEGELAYFAKSFELYNSSILEKIGKVAIRKTPGKMLVFIYDQPHFKTHISQFSDASVDALSFGNLFQDTMTQLVFIRDLFSLRSTAVFILLNMYLGHLTDIPVWLSNGIFLNLDSVIASNASTFDIDMLFSGFESYFSDEKSLFQQHQDFWNPDRIQAFWQGSLFDADDSNILCQHLSYYLVQNIAMMTEGFEAFISQASKKDAGEASARRFLNETLEGFIPAFLLEANDWRPKPDTWLK